MAVFINKYTHTAFSGVNIYLNAVCERTKIEGNNVRANISWGLISWQICFQDVTYNAYFIFAKLIFLLSFFKNRA